MSNILPVAATVNDPSVDQTVDASGQILLWLIDADGGYSDQDVQVNIEFKSSNAQYMRQGSMSYNKPSFFMQVKPGLVFRVKRILGTVGVDGLGQV